MNGDILLQDRQTRTFLKELIIEYAEGLEAIKTKWKNKFEKTFENLVKINFVHAAYEFWKDKKRKTFLEKAITRIHWKLQIAEDKINKENINEEWQIKYDHATNNVQIEDVIKTFLDVQDTRGNISCPFHDDQNPSLHIYKNTNKFHCFSCGACGSSIDFIMKYKDCDFKQAIEIISTI